jgi:hypothetical protein
VSLDLILDYLVSSLLFELDAKRVHRIREFDENMLTWCWWFLDVISHSVDQHHSPDIRGIRFALRGLCYQLARRKVVPKSSNLSKLTPPSDAQPDIRHATLAEREEATYLAHSGMVPRTR